MQFYHVFGEGIESEDSNGNQKLLAVLAPKLRPMATLRVSRIAECISYPAVLCVSFYARKHDTFREVTVFCIEK
jgi:hypothetical protein